MKYRVHFVLRGFMNVEASDAKAASDALRANMDLDDAMTLLKRVNTLEPVDVTEIEEA